VAWLRDEGVLLYANLLVLLFWGVFRPVADLGISYRGHSVLSWSFLSTITPLHSGVWGAKLSKFSCFTLNQWVYSVLFSLLTTI
jgi:hypothetical protein